MYSRRRANMYTEIVTTPAAASDAPRPMPAMATVLRVRVGFRSSDIDELSGEVFFDDVAPLSSTLTASLPLVSSVELLLLLVESASAVATGEAASAVPRLEVLATGALVGVADTVGEDTMVGGSVEGAELSLVLRAVVAVSLGHCPLGVSHQVADGTTSGAFGVAHELIDPEEVGVDDERGVSTGGPSGDKPAAGLTTVGDSNEASSSKKDLGFPQHCVLSSSKPQQNLGDAPEVLLWH